MGRVSVPIEAAEQDSFILPPAASYFSLTMANPGTQHHFVQCVAISLATGLHAPRQRCYLPANHIPRSDPKASLRVYIRIGTHGLQLRVPRRSRSLSRECCHWPTCIRRDKVKVGSNGFSISDSLAASPLLAWNSGVVKRDNKPRKLISHYNCPMRRRSANA